MQTETTYWGKVVDSPVGALGLLTTAKGLAGLYFGGLPAQYAQIPQEHPLLHKAERQLAQYFSGTRQAFDVPLDLRGTIFQLKAWKELQRIPYGQTISYGEQARRIGDANKARAVGAANGRNPLPIFIPCHRVVGVSGALVGFSAGVDIKSFLLEHETRAPGQARVSA